MGSAGFSLIELAKFLCCSEIGCCFGPTRALDLCVASESLVNDEGSKCKLLFGGIVTLIWD